MPDWYCQGPCRRSCLGQCVNGNCCFDLYVPPDKQYSELKRLNVNKKTKKINKIMILIPVLIVLILYFKMK